MQENLEWIKDILNDLKILFKKSEDLKTELIRQLIVDCPQENCLTIEEYTVQEGIKYYLSQLNEISFDDMNTIFKNYTFFQTMEIALGDKIGLLSNDTLGWIIEIDSALGAFTALPFTADPIDNLMEEGGAFPDENDLPS
jgi:hypothetical protein